LAHDVASRTGLDSIGEANWRFHQAIHRAANSPRLLTLIKQAAHVVPSNFLKIFPEHEQHSLDDHEHLLDALEAHHAARARRIAECHVLKAGRSLAEYLDHQYPSIDG
jgi:DNA-binding GntR family transcriptional regulator